MMTPERRRLRAEIAANKRWSLYMAREDQTAFVRAAFRARLERQVGPEGNLPPISAPSSLRSQSANCPPGSTQPRPVDAGDLRKWGRNPLPRDDGGADLESATDFGYL
jgi:hypothetical protein